MKSLIKLIAIAILTLVTPVKLALAQDLTKNPYHISQITIAFGRLLNLLVGLSSAAFIIMIFMTAIKFATSVDDPRGLEAAKQTGTMALIGFVVILGFFVIVRIFANAFGLDLNVLSPVAQITSGLQNLGDWGKSMSNVSP